MEKTRIKIRVGGRYKTCQGEKVTVTSRFRRKGEDVFLCSDEVARDRWGNAFVQEYLSPIVLGKLKFLEVLNGR